MKRRLLLIAPEFFDYYKRISQTLEDEGWEVVFLCDRPPVNSLFKIGIRKFRFLLEGYLNSYYRKKLKKLGPFDQVLIIRGESITPDSFALLRAYNCPIHLYFWDSVKNVPGALKLSQLCDKVFSFDSVDAKKYSFELLPLFYTASPCEASSIEYDWSFVGSDHSDRMRIIQKIRNQHPQRNFVFVYFPSSLIYIYRFFFERSFFSFKKNELGFKPFQKPLTQRIFNSSVAILDIQHPQNSGLTIRTMEVLSLGKKLITTNAAIKEYPFYNEKNICIIDRKIPRIPDEFFKTPSDPAVLNIMKDYEIKNWVRQVLRSGSK